MRFHKLEVQIEACVNCQFIADASDLANLRRSQKFYLGNTHCIPMADYLDDFPRLPFACCAFELEISALHGLMPVIAICYEIDEQVYVSVWSASDFVSDDWYPAGSIKIDRLTNQRMKYCDSAVWERRRAQGARALKALNDQVDFADAVMAVVGHALNVMNCVNVTTQTVEAPVALNKKRAKVGKPPLYDYKILVLAQGKTRIFPQGGTHDSPRIHLRRGHLKHRKSGTFWWQPHAVGDKKRGVVMKDYQAAPLMQAASP